MNKPLEPRHVLVNLAEQHAYVVDDGKVTFDTVVVVGADTPDRRTPEFSHTMTHLVLNPYWHIPRSIAISEYLPALRSGGARHLEVYSRAGRVNPANINFSRYSAGNFPYSLKQAPGPRNALGQVKFMFPNHWNIYLHDTPSRSLFAREQRTFSHGCVRVARPLELAYHLLAPQTETPRTDVEAILRTGRERRVDLEQPIGVHIVYWSAWVTPTGRANYRGDPYGRDARLLDALAAAGVDLPDASG
jgi:murein L,D-transpeptidase YcbB/YkuD